MFHKTNFHLVFPKISTEVSDSTILTFIFDIRKGFCIFIEITKAKQVLTFSYLRFGFVTIRASESTTSQNFTLGIVLESYFFHKLS